jgi:predicted DNA-binding WGR domain protein
MSTNTETKHCTNAREAREAHREGRRWRLRCVYVGLNHANESRHSDKFWELSGNGRRVTRRWGRRGTRGQSMSDTLNAGIEKFYEKLDKGYRPTVA